MELKSKIGLADEKARTHNTELKMAQETEPFLFA
jgi:hypothetical protein